MCRPNRSCEQSRVLPMNSDLKSRLAAIVGEKYVLDDPADEAPYLTEPRDLYRGEALCVVRPGNTAEVIALMKLCNDERIAVVPQGGNTGLVGGQIPSSKDQIVLSLK